MAACSLLTCRLPYTPPYDWETVLAFFRAHQLPYLEAVDDAGYERVIGLQRGLGWFRVEQQSHEDALLLSVQNGSNDEVLAISTTVRKMFDLIVDPAVLAEAMRNDSFLFAFWARHPGLRLARFWSAEEAMFTTVLGQLVSVRFGRVLIRELMEAAGSSARHPKSSEPISLFPSATQILQADLSSVRTSDARRKSIRAVAQAIEEGAFDTHSSASGKALQKRLREIPGIGAWTAEYAAMRGFHDDDAFPTTDYALKQEVKRHPKLSVESVRPWRAYAAVALWKSFAETKQNATTQAP